MRERTIMAKQPENPRETGRLAAYRFLVDILVAGLDSTTAGMAKASIRQILRGGELVKLNPTQGPQGQYVGQRLGDSFFSLGQNQNLGGFGEGLKEGLEEVLALVEKRHPDAK